MQVSNGCENGEDCEDPGGVPVGYGVLTAVA